MIFLLMAVGVLFFSGVLALLALRRGVVASLLGVVGVVTAALLGLIPVFRCLVGAPAESWQLEWSLPVGSFNVELDVLSAFFLLPIFGLAVVTAIYGAGYMRPWEKSRRNGVAWFFFNLLVASMVMVAIARNAVLFLLAWEVMAISSFFLVTFEDEEKGAQEAGWTYLVATHIGAAFLVFLFLWLGQLTGSLEFEAWARMGQLPAATAGWLFVLAVIGFGVTAGIMPLHGWLPEAHRAAPSHVSALMSGVVIKMGVYGLIRFLTWMEAPPLWWGWVLASIGLVSSFGGVLYAMAQRDLRRLLAYSSVENVGIIVMGLGLGLVGCAGGLPALAVLGWCGSLLHILNHAFFNGLLFMGAGSVYQATHRCRMDRLGGLGKTMPFTAAAFLVGSMAICGLPPLNGFLSELLILWGAIRGATSGQETLVAPALAILIGLGLVGGLAVATFTKAFGAVFLGEARTPGSRTRESGWVMLGPMWALTSGCLVMGFFAPMLIRLLRRVLLHTVHLAPEVAHHDIDLAVNSLNRVAWTSYVLTALVMGLAALRFWLLQHRSVSPGVTWDGGYPNPSPRMQYTGSSFVNPLVQLFGFLIRCRPKIHSPEGYFPTVANLASEPADVWLGSSYQPAFTRISAWLRRFDWRRQGQESVRWYVLYIAITLLLLVVWKCR